MIRTLLVCLLLSSSALAQEPDARALFEQANAATAQGRFADARDLYRRSLELEGNPATAFNLAVALTRTGEFVEAVQRFDALLEGEHGRISRAQQREVRNLQRDAERNVATLDVRLPPIDGLVVRVDGQRVAGTSRVDPGEHLVSVESPRHRPLEERVTLERGETLEFAPTLQLRPDLTRGRLVVDAPEGGHLSVAGGGEAMDHLDLELEAGTYELTLTGGGGGRTREVVVEAGATSRYEITPAPTRRVWLWVLAGVLVAGAAATVVALSLGEKPPREDAVYGSIATLSFGP